MQIETWVVTAKVRVGHMLKPVAEPQVPADVPIDSTMACELKKETEIFVRKIGASQYGRADPAFKRQR